MLSGILAGITWALETVILGVALSASPFFSTAQAIALAPFVSTFLHDTCSAIFLWIYNAIRGEVGALVAIFKTKSFKWLILASAIGGPVGMTGYVLTVNNMGASIGAVTSAIYPAVGCVLAFAFLKEKIRWYQWIFLLLTLSGVYGLSYSPTVEIDNFLLGLLGALMCALGWGVEAVLLAKCMKDTEIKPRHALCIRQTVSSLVYGVLILPVISGWSFTVSLFTRDNISLLLTIAAAALCATVSYLFYYRAISSIGASKAMALNITYTAWALVFTLVIFKDTGVLEPRCILCSAVVVICGILAATDVKQLIRTKKKLR